LGFQEFSFTGFETDVSVCRKFVSYSNFGVYKKASINTLFLIDIATLTYYSQRMGISEIKKILDNLNIASDVAKDTSAEIFILIQLVEQLSKDNEALKTENQKLRDAINLLKGEQGKPIFPGKTKGNQGNVSSEKEREKRKPKKKRMLFR